MAITIAELGSSYDNSDSATTYRVPTTSGTLNPTENCLLLWCYSTREATTAPGMTPPTVYGGTWSEVAAEQVDGISAVGAWAMQVDGDPAADSFNATVDGGVTALGIFWSLLAIQGHKRGTSVATNGTFVQVVFGPTGAGTSGTTATPNPATVSGLNDASNAQIFFSAHRGNSATSAEGGWTAGTTQNGGSPNYGGLVSWKIASADTTPTHTWTGSARYQSIYFEVAVARTLVAPSPRPARILMRK